MSLDEIKKYKLGELADITSSKRIFLSDYVSSGIPFYRSKEIIQKSLGEDINDVLYISESKYVEIKQKYGSPLDGDLLLSAVGERAGIPYVVKDDGDFYFKDGNLIWFRNIDKKLNIVFLCYWLKSYEGNNTLRSIMIGSAQRALTIIGLKELFVSLPSIKVQQKIASILSSLDDKIELNRQTNKTLEAIAQALFKEWFVDFNFPGATGEMQDSELGEIPKGWRVVSFEDELDADRGLSYKGAGLATSNAMPMHNLNSVYEGGGYKFEGIKYYTANFKEKHLIHPGDLIIANTEQGHKYLLIGYPAIVPSYFGDKGIFSHHIYRLKAKANSYLTSEYLFHLLLQPEIREQVVGFANGTTVNMLKIEGLQKPKFVIPPKELVFKYSLLALNFRSMQEENIKQNEILIQLRDTLLPKLMKGEIEIK